MRRFHKNGWAVYEHDGRVYVSYRRCAQAVAERRGCRLEWRPVWEDSAEWWLRWVPQYVKTAAWKMTA